MPFTTSISRRVRLFWASAAMLFSAVLISGCAGQVQRVEVEKPVPYAVAVATGCIDERGRPAVPANLKSTYTQQQWAAMPPGAKAAAVEAQAGKHLTYEELDRAATAGCTVAKPVDNPAPK